MSFFGQTVPRNLKTDGVHSYFSCGGNDTRSKPIFRPDVSQKSSSMQQRQRPSDKSSPYTEGRRKRANLPPFKLEFEAQQKPREIQVFDDLVKHNNRLNVNATSYSTHPQSSHILFVFANDSSTYMKCYSTAAHGPLRYLDCHSKSRSRVESQHLIQFSSIVFLANGMSIP